MPRKNRRDPSYFEAPEAPPARADGPLVGPGAGLRRPSRRRTEGVPVPRMRPHDPRRPVAPRGGARRATSTAAATGTPSAGDRNFAAGPLSSAAFRDRSRCPRLRCPMMQPDTTVDRDGGPGLACIPVSESKRLPCDLCGHPMEPEHAHYRCPAATTSSPAAAGERARRPRHGVIQGRYPAAMTDEVRARMWETGGVTTRASSIRRRSSRSRASADASVSPQLRRTIGDEVTLTVEVVPAVAGVAEAAEIMGWDKRRVITYIDRGSFPEPITSLASGRIWLREDVETYRHRVARAASIRRAGTRLPNREGTRPVSRERRLYLIRHGRPDYDSTARPHHAARGAVRPAAR